MFYHLHNIRVRPGIAPLINEHISNVQSSLVEERMHSFLFVRSIVQERLYRFFSFVSYTVSREQCDFKLQIVIELDLI